MSINAACQCSHMIGGKTIFGEKRYASWAPLSTGALKCCCSTDTPVTEHRVSRCSEVGLPKPPTLTSWPRMAGQAFKAEKPHFARAGTTITFFFNAIEISATQEDGLEIKALKSWTLPSPSSSPQRGICLPAKFPLFLSGCWEFLVPCLPWEMLSITSEAGLPALHCDLSRTDSAARRVLVFFGITWPTQCKFSSERGV